MPFRLTLLLCLTFWCVPSLAAERLSLQIAGGYTELERMIDHPVTVYPVIPNPFDPPEVIELPPAETRFPLPYQDDDIGWEASLSYRLWSNVHLMAGYGDLGRFDSELAVFGIATPIILRPPSTRIPRNPLPGVFDPGEVHFGVAAPPAGLSANQVSLNTEAWLLGVKVGHALSERAEVYVRLAGLRASFHVDSDFQRPFEFGEPSDRTGWAWGVGAQYAVFPRVSVGVAFSQYDVKLMKLDSYQLTLGFDLL